MTFVLISTFPTPSLYFSTNRFLLTHSVLRTSTNAIGKSDQDENKPSVYSVPTEVTPDVSLFTSEYEKTIYLKRLKDLKIQQERRKEREEQQKKLYEEALRQRKRHEEERSRKERLRQELEYKRLLEERQKQIEERKKNYDLQQRRRIEEIEQRRQQHLRQHQSRWYSSYINVTSLTTVRQSSNNSNPDVTVVNSQTDVVFIYSSLVTAQHSA